MAITHVGTNHATTGSGTSVTVTKPAGTTSDDLLLAFFSSNNQNCTPPAGFTEIADEVTETFRCQVFYKVAGGSEPANYAFSVGSNAILVASVACLRGIEASSPIDIAASADTDTTHSEPYTTPSLTGGTNGRLVYFRGVRRASSTPATFTASGVTELKDIGANSGSTSYAHAIYFSNSNYSGSGTKSGLAITCDSSETHNFVLTVGIKEQVGPTGTMGMTIPSIPSVSMAAEWAYTAVLDADLLQIPSVSIDIYNGEYEAELDVDVPITVNLAGNTPVRGPLEVEIPIQWDSIGETRFFGGNSIVPQREERWFVMTQDGYYLGIRTGVDLPMRIEMPLPVVNFVGNTATFSDFVSASATANDASVSTTFSAGAATVAATVAEDATMLPGALAMAEWAWAPVFFEEDTENTIVTFGAETVNATVEATNVIGASVTVDEAPVTITVYQPIVGQAKQAEAEHVSVSVTANSIDTSVSNAHAGTGTVSVTVNAPQIRTRCNSGHASVNCHN